MGITEEIAALTIEVARLTDAERDAYRRNHESEEKLTALALEAIQPNTSWSRQTEISELEAPALVREVISRRRSLRVARRKLDDAKTKLAALWKQIDDAFDGG
jgi:hypothetical protein